MQPFEAPISYAEHALDILESAVALIDKGERIALIASLNIEGGAARAIGSLAVVGQSAGMIGYLSNGCIDRDIIVQGQQAIETGEVRQVRYGAGSAFMDLPLPCGGALEIVIDPEPDCTTLRAARDRLRLRQDSTLVFCRQEGLVPLAKANQINTEHVVLRYAPKPALILAGRGAIVRQTAVQATQMDFDLHVLTPDGDDLAAISELGIKQIVGLKTPDQPVALTIDEHTAVLLMFHDHEWEQAILSEALKADPFYIGAMGSKKTHRMRIEALESSGASAQKCKTIHGPIGLVPSLRNASLIAMSALAEIVSYLPVSQSRMMDQTHLAAPCPADHDQKYQRAL